MSLGLMFWILMLLWFVLSVGVHMGWPLPGWSNTVLLFILFLILGWHAFGAPVK